ncbi:mutator family transposase [Chitinophaga ginsengisoli]|uniref:Mutator family transposase n=1 Tax=Chitinophaga ginsengisoli TaxID=363837 RepID=A0A2P8FQR7_9BACT|nr:mutator family transposase [Chitinophaga ginsengisoli]
MSDKLEEAIIGMYSRGMTTSDISEHVKEVYGVEVSGAIPRAIKKLDERFGRPPHEYLSDRSCIDMHVFLYDANTLMMFHRDIQISIRGEAEYFNIYSFTNGSWQHLYDNLERPKNKKVLDAFKNINSSETKSREITLQTLSYLHDHEAKILKELSDQPTSLTVFPLGIIWYYVIMVMANGKIDYFIPVGNMAKAVIFSLSLFRLIAMGILLNSFIKLAGAKI